MTATLLFGASSRFLLGTLASALIILVFVRPLTGVIVYSLVAPLGQLLGIWSVGPLNIQHLLGLLVPVATISRTTHRFADLPRAKYPVALLGIALVLTITLGSVGERHPGAYWIAVITAGHLAMFFATLALADSAPRQRQITLAILAGGVLAALLNLSAYFGYQELFTAAGIEVFDLRKGRFTGLTPNPNALSTVFVLVLPITYAAAASYRGLKRWASLLASGACLLVLIVAASRSALIGSAVGAALFVALTIRRSLKGSIALLIFLLTLIWGLSQTLPSHPVSMHAMERFGESMSGTILGGRPDAIQVTLKLIWENPIGVGLGAVSSQIHEYGFTKLSNPHNSILAIGAGLGWLGLLATLWLVAVQAIDGWRSSIRTPINPYAIAFYSGAAAFWIHASFHAVLHFGFLWVFFALAARVWSTPYSSITMSRSDNLH